MVKRVIIIGLFFALGVLRVDAEDYSPVKIEGKFDYITDADFDSSEASSQHMNYTQSNVEATYTQPLCEQYGLLLSGGFKTTRVDWLENPSFREKDFAYYTVGLGAYTVAVPDWTWILKARINVDIETCRSNHMLYDGILWGKHKYCCYCFDDMNLHFGFIGDTGQKKTLILPIIGADFVFNRFRFGVVFPIDLSVSYLFNDCLSLSTAVRIFYRRHRVSSDEPEPSGVFQYTNTGTEVALIYKHPCGLSANLHAGWTLEGDLKIADKEGNNSSHYKTEGAAYYGAEAVFSF